MFVACYKGSSCSSIRLPASPIALTLATGWSCCSAVRPEMGRRRPRLDRGRVAKKNTPKGFAQLSKAWTTCLALIVVHHDVIFRLTAAVSLIQRSFELLPFGLGEVARYQSFTASLLLELLDDISNPSSLLLGQGTLETGR